MGKAVSKNYSCLARLWSAWQFNRVCLFLGVLWLGHFYGIAVAYSQETGIAPKHAVALRVPTDVIRVDGRLNESIWETAVAITDFVQKEPDQGALPTDRM